MKHIDPIMYAMDLLTSYERQLTHYHEMLREAVYTQQDRPFKIKWSMEQIEHYSQSITRVNAFIHHARSK